MIKRLIYIFLPLLIVVVACERNDDLLNENNTWVYVDSTQNGFIKFVHAYAPTTPALTSGAGPSVHVYDASARISGAALVYNGTIPAPTGAYGLISPGAHNFNFVMSRATPIAGDTVFKSTATIEANKHYSVFLVDSVQNPGVLTVQDNWTVPPQGSYQVRYANFVANPKENYDVFSIRTGTNIFTNVAYRQVTNFIQLPTTEMNDTLIIRKAGTMNVIDSLKGFGPSSQRVYTVYTRGRAGITTRVPATTFYTNR
jgi:hypothetical protein